MAQMSVMFVEENEQNISTARLWELIFADSSIPMSMNPSKEDAIYVSESRTIRELAHQGPCVIVGRLGNWILRDNPYVLLLIINLLLLILGCFMDMGILIIMLTPILFPVAMQYGYNPYHFGIITVLTLGMGVLTPPVGTSLWAGCSIAGISMEKAIKGFLPFYLTYIAVTLAIILIPQISTALPIALGYIK